MATPNVSTLSSSTAAVGPAVNQIGIFTQERRISIEMIEQFVVATGDDNPLHLYDEVAKHYGFPGRIAHGKLIQAIAVDLIRRNEAGLGFAPVLIEDSWRSYEAVIPGDTIFVSYGRKIVHGLFILSAEVRAQREGLVFTAMTGRLKAVLDKNQLTAHSS